MANYPYLYPYNLYMRPPMLPYPYGFPFGFPLSLPESKELTLKYIDKKYDPVIYKAMKTEMEHVFLEIVKQLCEIKDDKVKFAASILEYIDTSGNTTELRKLKPRTSTFIFTKEKLEELHEKFHSDNFEKFKNKACGIKQEKWSLTITAAQSGGEYGKENSYINIEELFSQRPTQQLTCVMHGDKIKCSHSGAHMKCELCKRWMLNRELLRYVILKMLNQNNIIEMIDLLIENINLFPVAILNEQEFHQFHIAIDQFRQAKRNNQF